MNPQAFVTVAIAGLECDVLVGDPESLGEELAQRSIGLALDRRILGRPSCSGEDFVTAGARTGSGLRPASGRRRSFRLIKNQPRQLDREAELHGQTE
jgi:hypothetical protein